MGKQDPKQVRKYAWFLTFSAKNPTELTPEEVKEAFEKEGFRYVFQLEEGSEKENGLQRYEHYHALIYHNPAKSWNRIKTLFPRAHIEEVKTTKWHIYQYVTKEEGRLAGPFESEEKIPDIKPPKAGALTELLYDEVFNKGREPEEIAKDLMLSGVSIRTVKDIYNAKLEIEAKEFRNKLRTDLEVNYLSGPPGFGKTSWVTNRYGLENVYVVTNYKNPFDFYANEDVIVFEEYDGQIGFDEFKALLDIYPVKLKARYADKTGCYTKVWVLSNKRLEDQYMGLTNINRNALERRFTKRGHVLEITDKGVLHDLTSNYYHEENKRFEVYKVLDEFMDKIE